MVEKEIEEITQGEVTEALPSTMFRVEFLDGKIIICYLAGKMRLHRIKVLIGDKVMVKLDPYGGKGRIIKRL
ncbi:MAG: translation initiation factor IF-1 [Candidatus Yonathbacteria bacterium CG10_big_fil_rev_8_21_14_0_10_43_136]|uniref:Translation initiation factor IF-1 n=2 Tax=Parcubacteria group TaxID=1794811 RepID=A0A2M7Q5M7_9BACT|nr:MAG: translation initiation factor IF-1 [Candidatus Nomurabacteria bacterium CG2_30_43_9]PIQ35821.1 MAG: translation initiation factor IF-1 [Candidatus Yonathbacteria bacterium CG17_big_fil_post_rev_8_21_14_2_50_43_9]PIR40687.1 MAG: translation initiation factor IF-1 [Candidatus Yonathbacteria bacterium CG10_big_fil_rev_8_21_14_0_10_43_136]PIX57234.1 MAG: translation initiation factor IF-1 [Candidatus Yonathbacteria bacterium CG_4_10_14_3_um_filter_43_12]PIY58370.1 MAG: translation initiatio